MATQPYGVEVTESDIEELRESGELKFKYFMNDGPNAEITLFYDGDSDDDDDGGSSNFKVDTPLL